MSGNALTPSPSALIVAPAFAQVVDYTLRTIAASSARIYAQTYRAWSKWSAANAHDPLALRSAAILDFIDAQDGTRSTRQRQLSALRKLAQMYFVMHPVDDARRNLEALQFIRPPAPSAAAEDRERTGRALNPTQAQQLLTAWSGSSPVDRRNAALVALLLTTGIRRAEAAALRWGSVDLDAGTVEIKHGKGDQHRVVAIAGDVAVDALSGWRSMLGTPSDNAPVFCSIGKGSIIRADRALSGTDVYRVMAATEKRTGVEFKPHDLRRTFITEALTTGANITEVKAQAGHARADTTLRYAKATDARARRSMLRLRYGDKLN
jgi:integrase/recombinase XerD